jgi:hypothetical protein
MTLARIVPLVLCLVMSIPATAAGQAAPSVSLTGVGHALEGEALVITGWVENRGPRPVGRLVIDATGFAPSGTAVYFGSDGVPWEIPPGGTASFAVRQSLQGDLVRDYVVQVALAQTPQRPLASLRRSVGAVIYQPLLRSVVRLSGDIHLDRLTIRSDARGWPIEQVTVEALVRLPAVRARSGRLEALTLDVPGSGAATIGLGTVGATLMNLRVLEVRTRSTWSD